MTSERAIHERSQYGVIRKSQMTVSSERSLHNNLDAHLFLDLLSLPGVSREKLTNAPWGQWEWRCADYSYNGRVGCSRSRAYSSWLSAMATGSKSERSCAGRQASPLVVCGILSSSFGLLCLLWLTSASRYFSPGPGQVIAS